MFRDLYQNLIEWKSSPLRVPLILRGARQVGKSWLASEFGETYEHFLKINFEREPQASIIFEGELNPVDIVKRISLFCDGKPVIPGKSLIFLDEIQECEAAIKALRYFKEEMPAVHIIAAGSLLDFTLNNMGLPVGRVEFLHLYPLSFGEFLDACDASHLRKATKNLDSVDIVHDKLLDYLKHYYCIGGLPAVVSTWIETKDLTLCQKVQQRILMSYKQDFAKYANSKQISNVEKMFSAIPNQLGSKFKFSNVDRDITTHSLKVALELLITAGVAVPCYHTNANGLPLAAGMDVKKFKVFIFDIGLAQAILGLDLKDWLLSSIDGGHLGNMSEQFVAQELMACAPAETAAGIFYWQREARNANAEVDFLTVNSGEIIPLEVKSGKGGSMKSMRLFLESHPDSKGGVKLSVQPPGCYENIEDVPLYALEQLLKSTN